MSLKYAIITGASSGLGLHFAKWLYANGGYSIVLGCRGREKAQHVLAEFQNLPIPSEFRDLPRQVKYLQLDLACIASVEHFVEEFSESCQKGELHLLVNNAGIMNHPFATTENGVEIHFATNFLGHFALTNLLLDHFAPKGRILNITSGYYERCGVMPDYRALCSNSLPPKYSPTDFYAISKLANCLHVVALHKKIEEEKLDIKVVAIRPGFVRGTELGRHTNYFLRLLAAPLIWLVAKNLDQGIAGMTYCSTCDYNELSSGVLYHGKDVVPYNQTCVNDKEAAAIWRVGTYFVKSIKSHGIVNFKEELD